MIKRFTGAYPGGSHDRNHRELLKLLWESKKPESPWEKLLEFPEREATGNLLGGKNISRKKAPKAMLG